MKKEMRQAPRHKGQWPVSVTWHGKVYRGTCRDISILGLGVHGLPPLPAGSEMRLSLELGPMLALQVNARVVRQQPDAAAPESGGQRLITGFSFLQLDSRSLGLLHSHLAGK